MTLLQIDDIKKSYGPHDVLQGVTARIFKHSRIGLVGANGAGKTTLMRILLGEFECDGGEIIRRKNIKIAYLPQIPILDDNNSVFQQALKADDELYRLEGELEQIEESMGQAADEEMEKLIDRQADIVEIYERKGGYRYRADTEAFLEKLGFGREDLSLPVSALSGGQKNRLGLVCTLLAGNDLLLLDEPTNFLDVESTEWLEQHLKSVDCAMVVISHDRYFLNEVVTDIWDLDNGCLECYPGNYDKYRLLKRQKLERQQELYLRQQEEIKKHQEFVRRNIYGQKYKQALSRRKSLEKIEKLQAVKEQEGPHFAIYSQNAKSGRVLEARDLGHAYGSTPLFRRLSFALDREEKMAIVGPNGCGKSTLLHILLNRIEPSEGSSELNPKITVGFYHQELEELKTQYSAFDTIKNLSPTTDDGPVRDFLAGFLFCGDDVYKKAGDMSGGEKSRLALAKLLYEKPYFLVLDEPTNHLDIFSRQALEKALRDYTGTLLFVSHDRYFIDQVATCLLYFHEKSWILFYGNYSQFQASKHNLLPKSSATEKARRNAYLNVTINRTVKKKKRKKHTLEELEEMIILAESRLDEITEELGSESVYRDAEKVKELNREYDTLNSRLKELNEEWENWDTPTS